MQHYDPVIHAAYTRWKKQLITDEEYTMVWRAAEPLPVKCACGNLAHVTAPDHVTPLCGVCARREYGL